MFYTLNDNTSDFCITSPYIFEPGVYTSQGYVSVQCASNECTKTCDSPISACNGTILSPTNISKQLSGPINVIEGNQNNIIVLINCSNNLLDCTYISTSAAPPHFNVQPKSIFVVESTAPSSTGTYSCVKI